MTTPRRDAIDRALTTAYAFGQINADARLLPSVASKLMAKLDADPTEAPGYYCDQCPHAMHLHDADGHCGGGCH